MTLAIVVLVLTFAIPIVAIIAHSVKPRECFRRQIPGSSVVASVSLEHGRWVASLYDPLGGSKDERWIYQKSFATKEQALNALLPRVQMEAMLTRLGP